MLYKPEPQPLAQVAEPPDLLPARMLNEFVYCPRLFYYEWVEGLFAQNTETVEGALRHRKTERQEPSAFPAPETAAEAEKIHARSLSLSSAEHGLIATIDIVEGEGGVVSPVDYKRGSPRETEAGLAVWDTDRIQLAAQALVLRANGYRCEEGIVYYVATRQRVGVPITDEVIAWTLERAARAREAAAAGLIPPPLVNSPKCPRCSLVGICLPDETRWARRATGRPADAPNQLELFHRNLEPQREEERGADEEPRRLVPARDDLRPLYLNSQGMRVGVSGGVIQMRDTKKLLQEARLSEINQVNLFGNIQISTQALQALCSDDIPVAYFSMGGWFYGLTRGMGLKNIFLRREQFRYAEIPLFCLHLARALVAGKIQNQRILLQRNHVEPPLAALAALKQLSADAARADALETLLGVEGQAARIYFEHFAGMLKAEEPADAGSPPASAFRFDFNQRNRRPPRDPVNALLSLAYSVLAKDLVVTCHAVGFDPFLGYYHQPRFGRPALALDLMEPFRPLVADSAVLTAINNRMVTSDDFVQAGPAVMLKSTARKSFFRAYEQRMDTLATHPLFNYRVNYRRLLEIQTRLLARLLTGEIADYPVFVTK